MNWERLRQDLRGLGSLIRAIGNHFDHNAIVNQTLPKVAQHIGVQQNFHIYFIRSNKPKAFYEIKPSNCSGKRQTAINSVSGHVYLSVIKLNNFKYLILNAFYRKLI